MIFMFVAFAVTFMFCELGQRITDKFEEINDEIGRWNWYKLPLSVQKILPILLSGTQQPVTLRGYGNVLCTRETLKNVRFNKILSLCVLSSTEQFSTI